MLYPISSFLLHSLDINTIPGFFVSFLISVHLPSTRLRREKILILGLVLLLVITLNNSWQQNPHLVTPRALKETPSEAQRETLRETAPPNKTQTLIEETLKANQEAIGQDKNETAPVCRCVTSSWLESDFISPYLSLTMPWDNTTIYRELQERHPNLPVELLSSKVKKRCSLLPTIFRCELCSGPWICCFVA